jgi:uncharacterized membrane protein
MQRIRVEADDMAQPHARSHIHQTNSFGQAAADRIANVMGSWTFIIAQSIFVGGWILLNLVAVLHHWDAYPFILLILLFSTQAAYAAPIIMMSQNRQAQKDHLRDDHEAAEVDLLFKINRQQLKILHLLHQGRNIDQPLDVEADAEIEEQAERLEAEADELERALGVDDA